MHTSKYLAFVIILSQVTAFPIHNNGVDKPQTNAPASDLDLESTRDRLALASPTNNAKFIDQSSVSTSPLEVVWNFVTQLLRLLHKDTPSVLTELFNHSNSVTLLETKPPAPTNKTGLNLSNPRKSRGLWNLLTRQWRLRPNVIRSTIKAPRLQKRSPKDSYIPPFHYWFRREPIG